MKRAILACLILWGCAAPEPVIMPTHTKCPEPPVITRPTMKVDGLTGKATSSEVIRAYVEDWIIWNKHVGRLELYLDAYRK